MMFKMMLLRKMMKKEMLNWVFEIDVCCKAMEMQHIHV